MNPRVSKLSSRSWLLARIKHVTETTGRTRKPGVDNMHLRENSRKFKKKGKKSSTWWKMIQFSWPRKSSYAIPASAGEKTKQNKRTVR